MLNGQAKQLCLWNKFVEQEHDHYDLHTTLRSSMIESIQSHARIPSAITSYRFRLLHAGSPESERRRSTPHNASLHNYSQVSRPPRPHVKTAHIPSGIGESYPGTSRNVRLEAL